MKQRIIIPLSCFAVVVILLLLLFQVYSLRSEVDALRQQLDQAEASIQSNGDQIRLAGLCPSDGGWTCEVRLDG